MWAKLIAISDNNQEVIAKLQPEMSVDHTFGTNGLEPALKALNVDHWRLLDDEVARFVSYAQQAKSEAFVGVVIARQQNATVNVSLSEQDMLATLTVTGAYGGKPLTASQIVEALNEAKVVKGINKNALKKALADSQHLKAGETVEQPVAQGINPVQGRDTQFQPMVEDPTKRILAPKETDGKVDMLDLGETITVDVGEPLMKRIPATKGRPGITVLGKVIPPQPGKDLMMKASKGSEISKKDPNLLIASVSGMPMFKDKSVEVEDALCLKNIGVATGHIKFKGNVVVTGDIESDMVVRVTGSLTVAGFIESADVQVQGDIQVGKGIIGHAVDDDEEKSCVVKSGGHITANYAQFCELQAAEDIKLTVHCMNSIVRCGHNLIVSDEAGKQGTLSGGNIKVGEKVTCVNLGVEGDTATHLEAYARYNMYKERFNKLKEYYQQAQERTMDLVRKELEFKKKPKAERGPDEEKQLELMKSQANSKLEQSLNARDSWELELNSMLEQNIVEVTGKVFTHVTIQFGDEKVLTKRTHGPSIFSFNQYEIKCQSMLDEEDLEVDL